jgi:hypothetical protein
MEQIEMAFSREEIDIEEILEPRYEYSMIYPFVVNVPISKEIQETEREAEWGTVVGYHTAREILSHCGEEYVRRFAEAVETSDVSADTARELVKYDTVLHSDEHTDPEELIYSTSDGYFLTTEDVQILESKEVLESNRSHIEPQQEYELHKRLASCVQRYAELERVDLSKIPVRYREYPEDASPYYDWPATVIGDQLSTPDGTMYSDAYWTCPDLDEWLGGLSLAAVSLGYADVSELDRGWFQELSVSERIDLCVKVADMGVAGDPPYAVLTAIGENYGMKFKEQKDSGIRILTYKGRRKAEEMFENLIGS